MFDPNGTNTLDDLLEAGWRDAATDPPNDDRTVQIAWDDGSTSDGLRGFHDSISGHGGPKYDGKRFWWHWPWEGKAQLATPLKVLAWREID